MEERYAAPGLRVGLPSHRDESPEEAAPAPLTLGEIKPTRYTLAMALKALGEIAEGGIEGFNVLASSNKIVLTITMKEN